MDPTDRNDLFVKQLQAQMAALQRQVYVLRYGLEHCTVVLECDDEGGGTITITFPEPPDSGGDDDDEP